MEWHGSVSLTVQWKPPRNTSADDPRFKISPFSCLNVAFCVDVSFQIPLKSINRVNQTDSARFSILPHLGVLQGFCFFPLFYYYYWLCLQPLIL
jgi:hypothetical protein